MELGVVFILVIAVIVLVAIYGVVMMYRAWSSHCRIPTATVVTSGLNASDTLHPTRRDGYVDVLTQVTTPLRL